MVNLPAFFTSAVARLAKLSRSAEHSDFFRPLLLAKASAMPVLEMDLAETAFFFMATIVAVNRRAVVQASRSFLSP